MTQRRRIRKFIVTVEEITDDPQEVTHQELPPVQTRKTWLNHGKRVLRSTGPDGQVYETCAER